MHKFKIKEELIGNMNLMVSIKSKQKIESSFVLINDKIFGIDCSENISDSQVQLSLQNKFLLFGMEDPPSSIQLSSFKPLQSDDIKEMTVYLSYECRNNSSKKQIGRTNLQVYLRKFLNQRCLNDQSSFSFKYKNLDFSGRVQLEDGKKYGIFKTDGTKIHLDMEPHQNFRFVNSDEIQTLTNPEDFDTQDYKSKLAKIKVGGLNEQIEQIARRIFASRGYRGQFLEAIGITHVKGMLLYGPPGTGKTLLARELAKILDVKPTIVNGPQITDKYVGEGQRKLRQIFQPAIDEYKKKGHDSSLHLIIFDEIDAFAKKRGSNDSSICDSLVNQLLTLIDGVESPNNILVIGMTNRKDLIDEALIRSGRLEVHIEVHLPSEQGRKDILGIHLDKIMKQNRLADDVSIEKLAGETKNYTGAEIQSLIKCSASFAMQETKEESFKLTANHFAQARKQITPQFGQDERQIENLIPAKSKKIEQFPERNRQVQHFFAKAQSLSTGRESLLIFGPSGSGKTILAAQIAKIMNISFTKFVTIDKMYSLSDSQKKEYLIKVFEDAKRCESSCIILDDILRIIEYIPLGSRYNNQLLQLVLNLMKSSVPKTQKQHVIVTAEQQLILQDFGLLKSFGSKINLMALQNRTEQEQKEQYCPLC